MPSGHGRAGAGCESGCEGAACACWHARAGCEPRPSPQASRPLEALGSPEALSWADRGARSGSRSPPAPPPRPAAHPLSARPAGAAVLPQPAAAAVDVAAAVEVERQLVAVVAAVGVA